MPKLFHISAKTLLVGAALLSGSSRAQESAPAMLKHADLGARLNALADSNERVDLEVLGRSRTGKEIFSLRISDGGATPGAPAILVVANIDGPNVFSSSVALSLAERLAVPAGADEGVDELLSAATVYIVPRANPDGAEARFASPRHAAEATGAGVDEDRDGRLGEDGPSDVDGDGRILEMRVPDADGEWRADPDDERATSRADASKGEVGVWKVFPEGRDSDGDERASEDSPTNAYVNRNFPGGWSEHDATAGHFPSAEPEARALMDFVLAHPDIVAVITYGYQDNVAKSPKAAKGGGGRPGRNRELPHPEWLGDDARLMSELGRRYRERVEKPIEGRGSDAGSFQRWVYYERGLLALNVCLWDIPLDAKKPEPPAEDGEDPEASEGADEGNETEEDAKAKDKRPKKGKQSDKDVSEDAKRLRWIDLEEDSWRFVPWTPFEHPELGAVEIGGFDPYARLEPPAEDGVRIGSEQFDFLLALGSWLPRTSWVECTATQLEEGLFEIEAVVHNEGLLPVLTAAAAQIRSRRPARIRARLPEGAVLLAGSLQVLVSDLDGSGDRHEERWLVQTDRPGDILLELDTDGAGRATIQPEAK